MRLYGYIALLLLTANHAYSQLGYVWYKTFSTEDELMCSISPYLDSAFAVSSFKTVWNESSSINSVYVTLINEEGELVKTSMKASSFEAGNVSWFPMFSDQDKVVMAGYRSNGEACSVRMNVCATSSNGYIIQAESDESFSLKYPMSICKGNSNLYYVSGDEYRSETPGQCYIDSINRFVVAYDMQGQLLWKRSYQVRKQEFSTLFYSSP